MDRLPMWKGRTQGLGPFRGFTGMHTPGGIPSAPG